MPILRGHFVEPILSRSGNLRLNFENIGKGETKGDTAVSYTLKERGTNSVLTGSDTLQPLGPGKQATFSVPEIRQSNPYDRYEYIVISWQGKEADDRPFNGSSKVAVNQFRVEQPRF
jgi:hypothetical protein